MTHGVRSRLNTRVALLLNDEFDLQQRRETVCLTHVAEASDCDLGSCGGWFCLERAHRD